MLFMVRMLYPSDDLLFLLCPKSMTSSHKNWTRLRGQVSSIKRECLNHFAYFSLNHLDHIAQTYMNFYNRHRPHQSMGNQPLLFGCEPLKYTGTTADVPHGKIRCEKQLGGLLWHYYRLA